MSKSFILFFVLPGYGNDQTDPPMHSSLYKSNISRGKPSHFSLNGIATMKGDTYACKEWVPVLPELDLRIAGT